MKKILFILSFFTTCLTLNAQVENWHPNLKDAKQTVKTSDVVTSTDTISCGDLVTLTPGQLNTITFPDLTNSPEGCSFTIMTVDTGSVDTVLLIAPGADKIQGLDLTTRGDTLLIAASQSAGVYAKNQGVWQFFSFGQSSELVATKVDASTNPYAETLPVSTNSGKVKKWVLIDKTNAATLSVPAGQTLAGSLNGTFTFSTYAEETAFEAVEVDGGWVVSVVGASTQTDLSYLSMLGEPWISAVTASAGLSSQNVLNLDDAQFAVTSQNGMVVNGAENTIGVTQDGRYYLQVSGRAAILLRAWIYVNGVSVARTPGDVQSGDNFSIETITDLVAGDRIEIGTNAAPGNVFAGNVNLQQLPTTESVLAGMVTPEDKKDLILDGVGNSAISFSNSLTIAEIISTYESIEISTWSPANNSSSTGVVQTAALQKSIDNGATEHRVFLSAGQVSTGLETTSIDIHLTNNEIDISNGADATGSITTETTIYGVKKQKTVVMPDALEVEDVTAYNSVTADAAPNTNVSLTSVIVPTDGDYIIHTDNVFASGNTNIAIFSGHSVNNNTVPTEQSEYRYYGGSKVFSHQSLVTGLTAGDIVYGWINHASAGTTGAKQNVYITPASQKTVINTTDTPVNDQATSGYMDIGTMRIQWGVVSDLGSDGDVNVAFPQAFANTNYSITATVRTAGEEYAVSARPNTAGDFILNRNDSAVGVADWNWQAIGLKP